MHTTVCIAKARHAACQSCLWPLCLCRLLHHPPRRAPPHAPPRRLPPLPPLPPPPQKLLSSKAHDHEGFYIINAVVEGLPLPAYEQFLPTVFTLMFQRLSSSKTQKVCVCVYAHAYLGGGWVGGCEGERTLRAAYHPGILVARSWTGMLACRGPVM